jgi:tRNA(His) 5'-end guanylyltransferase
MSRGVRKETMRKLYSQRKAPPKTNLVFTVDDRVRERMLSTIDLADHTSRPWIAPMIDAS